MIFKVIRKIVAFLTLPFKPKVLGVMTDSQIKEAIRRGEIKVSDYCEDLVNPASLDVRLSKHFSWLEGKDEIVDPLDKTTYSYSEFEADYVIIPPRGRIIASTQEIIELPDSISYRLIGKSSLARLFIDNSSFGAWAEADFGGSLVMEIVNHNPFSVKLTAGMKIGQLVFYRHIPAEVPYSKRASSKYMHQKPAQGSMYWKNQEGSNEHKQ